MDELHSIEYNKYLVYLLLNRNIIIFIYGRMSKNKSNFQAKVVVVGNQGVGKTCISSKLCGLELGNLQSSSTVGTDILRLDVVDSDNQRIRINFWDTAGQQKYRTIAKTYFKGATAALFVFSVQNENSFSDLREWIKESNILNQERDIAIAIIGNKTDMNPKFQFSAEQLEIIDEIEQELSSRDINSIHKFLVSAKTESNLDILKQWIINQVSAIVKQKNPLGNRHIYLSQTTNSFVIEAQQNNRVKQRTNNKCC